MNCRFNECFLRVVPVKANTLLKHLRSLCVPFTQTHGFAVVNYILVC